MRFDNVEFSKVIERIQKKFDVTINLNNPDIRNCHVNVDITDNSLEDSLKKLTAILNVEYKINGSMIKLTGTGCK
jgi:transmembrane sensor